MALKKPATYFYKEVKAPIKVESSHINNSSPTVRELSENLSDAYNRFKDNVRKMEDISYDKNVLDIFAKIETINENLSNKLEKSDLENAMLYYLLVLEDNLKNIREEIKEEDKNNLYKLKRINAELKEVVEISINQELPKYKKLVLDNEFKILNKFNEFSSEIDEDIENLDEKIEKFSIFLNEELKVFDEKISNTHNQIFEVVETYKNLYKILESKTLKENEQLENYQEILDDFSNKIEFFNLKINESFDEYKTDFSNNLNEKINEVTCNLQEELNNYIKRYESFKDNIKTETSDLRKDFSSTRADLVVNEQHIKKISKVVESIELKSQENHENIIELKEDVNSKIETFIEKNYSNILSLKEEIYSEINNLPIGNIEDNIKKIEDKILHIQEVYSKIEPEKIIQEVLTAEPPGTKNSDPLTPLDQNFVTKEQLQQHYRLFINRIQQQLSTLGGGGETRLKYLDDIVGIATNASAYDNKYLKYNHSIEKFEFVAVSGGGGESYWISTNVGIHTLSNVGIGTTVPTSRLTVDGDAIVTGIVTALDFNSSSDINLKENIHKIENPLEKISQINGVTFNWKETKKESIGVIAQEVEKVLPQIVNGNDLKTLNYNGLIGLLVEGIKTQQQQINELREEINNLKTK